MMNLNHILKRLLLMCPVVMCLIKSHMATWSTVYESPMIKDPKPGWVRFCKGDQVYDTFANQCPAGIFWNKDKQNTQWDCVCTRGSWRRSSGWCTDEDTQRFTQGEITCFKLDPTEKEGLQGLYYVGDRFSAWDSSLPILLTDYRSGIPVRKGDFSVEWEIASRKRKEPGIIMYRPRDDWTVYDKLSKKKLRLCLRAPDMFNEETTGLYIYNVTNLFAENEDSLTIQLSITRGCYSWKEHDVIEWEEVIAEDLQEKNMIVPHYNKNTAPAECVQCMIKPMPPPPESDIDGSPLEDREEFTIYDLKNIAVLKSEIDLQTDRLGQYWAKRMLHNGSDIVAGNFQEIEVLTRAAIMAWQTCNDTHIPLEFYQYFLIMFRVLLGESFKKFPPGGGIGKEYYSKITEMLNKCKDRNLGLTFYPGKSCPPIYEEYRIGNTSEPRKINLNDTKDYPSDKGRHDFLLEFVWRLNSFLNYKCFQEFEQNSLLVDVIQQHIEAMYTEDLILRWYNPGSSFKMYSLIFENHFDLDATMKNFQRCISVVHENSKYPGWLKRPIDRPEVAAKKGGKGFGRRWKRSNNGFLENIRHVQRIRRKRDANVSTTFDDEYYEDEDETGKGPYNLFAGSAACLKSVRNFMMDTGKEAGPTCW